MSLAFVLSVSFQINTLSGTHRKTSNVSRESNNDSHARLKGRDGSVIRVRIYVPEDPSTLSVPSCRVTLRRHEGWDTARSPKLRQGKSRGRGRVRTTDLPCPHPNTERVEWTPPSKTNSTNYFQTFRNHLHSPNTNQPWTQLDHVAISHRWRATIQDCRSFWGTPLDSDHAMPTDSAGFMHQRACNAQLPTPSPKSSVNETAAAATTVRRVCGATSPLVSHSYLQKGYGDACENHRGTSLVAEASKVFSGLLLRRST
ncbi:hypothetical protein T265_09801 [Opisthorchis viverrini]|uniref:Uncharacterized protein n=1 Tax=Opisthorchis viverrini TaxID=6198 RepID=A0A074Z8U6_OPIVI|nr:hypothetical protein T265_09801 [Opisthorchis viverrini]KER22007.1 hypothetical protein T265_09801 [Opisthorchis viverrini]